MANKATNFIKQYFFMLALAATFIGFSAFKFADSFSVQDPVTLYFQGVPTIDDDVEEASNWVEDPMPSECEGSLLACSITVNEEDVFGTSGSRELDPERIVLTAIATASGYVPIKNVTESESDHPISVDNRN